MKAFLYWQRGESFVSDRIASITRPLGWDIADTPSHVGIGFSDGWAFEAHALAGGWTMVPTVQLLTNRCWHVDLGEDHAAFYRAQCEAKLGWLDYDTRNIVWFWGWRRLRLGLLRPKRSTGRVICSEAVARILYPYVDWPERLGLRPQRFDAISPAAMMEWHAHRCEVLPGLPKTA